MNTNAALQLVNLLLLAAERGVVLGPKIAEIRAKQKQMADENRDPTAAEWAEVRQLILGDAEATIEDAAARARRAMGEDPGDA